MFASPCEGLGYLLKDRVADVTHHFPERTQRATVRGRHRRVLTVLAYLQGR